MGRQESQDHAAELARLPKLLARLESDQEAEVLAAARAASRLVRVAGLSWDEVILQAPAKGWRSLIDLGRQLAAETRRRMAAERAAHHWQTLARLREEAARAPQSSPISEPTAPEAASAPEAPPAIETGTGTGHPLIDALLAAPALNAAQRIRVEAIASWYRRSGDLLDLERQDLEYFGQLVGLLPRFSDQRVAA